MEDNQEDYVYEETNDDVSPTNIVYSVVFVDDSENKSVYVAIPNDVSDSPQRKRELIVA